MFEGFENLGQKPVHELRFGDIIHNWTNDTYYDVLYCLKYNHDQYTLCIAERGSNEKGRDVKVRWNDHFETWRPINKQ